MAYFASTTGNIKVVTVSREDWEFARAIEHTNCAFISEEIAAAGYPENRSYRTIFGTIVFIPDDGNIDEKRIWDVVLNSCCDEILLEED